MKIASGPSLRSKNFHKKWDSSSYSNDLKLQEEFAERPESLKHSSMWFNTYNGLEYQ